MRNLDTAFKNFFQGRARYPTFKKKQSRQSVRYTSNGFSWREGKIKLAKQKEPLNIRWSRPFTGTPSSVTVSKDSADRYHVSVLVEESVSALPSSKRCHACGHICDAMPLTVRVWGCPTCHAHHDRDINAAKNILKAGKAILAGADKLRAHEQKTTVGRTGG